MIRNRIIPCLLLKGRGLVKTVRFRDPTYLGDPINIVRIFNEKEADEVILLDIEATSECRPPPLKMIEQIAGECFMPLAYGGGIRSVDDIREVLGAGVEKVALNTAAVEDTDLVQRAAGRFGSQSIVVSIDVKRTWRGRYEVMTRGARRSTGLEPERHAQDMEKRGAGEILLTAVDRDGMMNGYDLDLIRRVSEAVGVPVIACGGAGSVRDLARAVKSGGASAAAAGSLFVFQGAHRAVLISFPTPQELAVAFG